MKLFRRKPKAPMTPRRHYEDELFRLFGWGLFAGLGVVMSAYGLVHIKDAIEAGSATAGDWAFNDALFAIGLVVAVTASFRFNKAKNRLMRHAPDEEIVGPMAKYRPEARS